MGHLEEGTTATWLNDLLKPYVDKVVVCDPRKNALPKAGNKNDRVDAASWPICCEPPSSRRSTTTVDRRHTA